MNDKVELPLLSEVLKAYENGEIPEFEGVIRCRPFPEHDGRFWIPYSEIVIMCSKEFKSHERDLEYQLFWGKTE